MRRFRNLGQDIGFAQTTEIQSLKLLTNAFYMHVCVGKAWQRGALDCDPARVLCGERFHLGARADRNDSAVKYGHSFGLGMRRIQRDELTDEYRFGRRRWDRNRRSQGSQ